MTLKGGNEASKMTDETLETPVNPTETGAGVETPEPGKPGAKFTQAELDNHIAERLKREREKYKGYDDLKKKADAYDQQVAAQLSEEEKLKAKLAEATMKVEQAEARRKQALIGAAVTEAMQGKIAPDRLQAAKKLLDVSALTVGDDDSVDGVDAALDQLLKDNPFLKADEKQRGAGLSPTNPSGGASGDRAWIKDLPIFTGGAKGTFGKGISIVHGDDTK